MIRRLDDCLVSEQERWESPREQLVEVKGHETKHSRWKLKLSQRHYVCLQYSDYLE